MTRELQDTNIVPIDSCSHGSEQDRSRFIRKQNTYKLIAAFLMSVDHIGILTGDISLRAVGRLTILLFLFSFVAGTKMSTKGFSIQKFLVLLGVALISQPLTNFLSGRQVLNIMFLYVLFYIFVYTESKNEYIQLLQVILFTGLAIILRVDYSFYGFLVLWLCYKINKPILLYASIILLSIIYSAAYLSWISALMILSLIFIILIEKEILLINWKIPRWFFYVFYPAHIAILCGIKYLLLS